MDIIKDNTGRVIGRVDRRSDKTVYLTPGGALVGFYKDGRTYTNEGRFIGYGDQGMLLLANR